MDMGLNDKAALITGGSKGIGLAVAMVPAEEGCHLHLAARTGADLTAAADAIRAARNVRIETHVSDLSVTADLEALAAACPDIDILVNNAGAIPRGTLSELGWQTQPCPAGLESARTMSSHPLRQPSGRLNNIQRL